MQFYEKLLILPQLSAINADPAQNWHASSTPPGGTVIQFSRFKSSISQSYDRSKLASFPYWKSHQKFRIFASARFRLNRHIFRFFLHGQVAYDLKLRRNVKVSSNSMKIRPKNRPQHAKKREKMHYITNSRLSLLEFEHRIHIKI